MGYIVPFLTISSITIDFVLGSIDLYINNKINHNKNIPIKQRKLNH